MAYALVDEARAALRFNPNVNLAQYLQPFLAQMGELLRVEQGGEGMHEIMHTLSEHYLATLATSTEPLTRQTVIADYLLQHDQPEWDAKQRLLYIQQSQPKRTKLDAQIAYIAEHRPHTMSQDEWHAMLANPRYNSRSKDSSNRYGFLGTDKEQQHYDLFSKRAIPRPEPTIAATATPDYARYQQCKSLLSAIHKTREEVIDLDHALPHALRSLNRLAAILGQESSAPLLEKSAIGQAVDTVFEPVTTSPRTVGITADPIARIREQIAQQKASIQTNFLGLLARNDLTPTDTKDGVTLASTAVIKLFGVWQRLEKSGKLTKSDAVLPREQRDTMLELLPPKLAHEEIDGFYVKVSRGYLKLKVKRPETADKWSALCKSIEEYAREHHLQFPEMPAYAEMPATHEMYLRPLVKTRETPNVKVMANSVEMKSPPRARTERLRTAIKTVDLPIMDDWPKAVGR